MDFRVEVEAPSKLRLPVGVSDESEQQDQDFHWIFAERSDSEGKIPI